MDRNASQLVHQNGYTIRCFRVPAAKFHGASQYPGSTVTKSASLKQFNRLPVHLSTMDALGHFLPSQTVVALARILCQFQALNSSPSGLTKNAWTILQPAMALPWYKNNWLQRTTRFTECGSFEIELPPQSQLCAQYWRPKAIYLMVVALVHAL